MRIAAQAFGPGTPVRDLFLSPDHAVFHDGALILVKRLLTGETVVQIPTALMTYFHVDLARHDVLFAEDLPVESCLDTGDPGAFENGGVAPRLYPDFAARALEAAGCAPLVIVGPPVERARAQLVAPLQPAISLSATLTAKVDPNSIRLESGNSVNYSTASA